MAPGTLTEFSFGQLAGGDPDITLAEGRPRAGFDARRYGRQRVGQADHKLAQPMQEFVRYFVMALLNADHVPAGIAQHTRQVAGRHVHAAPPAL